jgi:hypothetical protein
VNPGLSSSTAMAAFPAILLPAILLPAIQARPEREL